MGAIRRHWRVLAVGFGVFVALVVAWVVFVVNVIAHPAVTSQPTSADAIVVLGPSNKRVPQAVSLARELGIGQLVLSVGDFPGQTDICRQPRLEVTCFVPDPYSTAGEAAAVGQLAKQHKWGSIIVVAAKAQASRAHYLIKQCFKGQIQMVSATNRESQPSGLDWVYQSFYQSGAWAKAVFDRPCSDSGGGHDGSGASRGPGAPR